MYPYRRRMSWFLGSRYAHLVRALDNRRRQIQDSTLETRVEAIRFWNRVHTIVLILLSVGVAATVAGWVAGLLPAFEAAAQAIQSVTRFAGAASGALTVFYLFLTRLLGQLEVDVLSILALDHGPGR